MGGNTGSTDLPVSPGPLQLLNAGGPGFVNDAFVVKLDANGVRLWATYYGGTDMDQVGCIATDAAGNSLLTGVTYSNNFPTGAAAGNVSHQNISGGSQDAFLLKLNPFGARLWATYYGGTNGEWGKGISTDGVNIYICGLTASDNAISSGTAFQLVRTGTYGDGFVVKFASNGSRIWGTYIGGSNGEQAEGITCEPLTGNIYVTGVTQSSDFPVLLASQPVFGGTGMNGNGDAFLFKFSTTGTQLWSTYYGGSSFDYGYGVACNGLGDVVLTGVTQSQNNISTSGAQQVLHGPAANNLFISKFSRNGVRQWGTYLGGNANNGGEWQPNIAIDDNNYIYIYGEWEDGEPGNYPISSCAYQPTFGGVEDGFIAKYDNTGKQLCVTYIGGAQEDDLDALPAADLGGGRISVYGSSIYITGTTQGAYPVTSGAFQTVYAGGGFSSGQGDAFINKLCINICEAKALNLDITASQTTSCPNQVITFSPPKNTCDTSTYTYQWTFTGANPSSSSSANPAITYSSPGTYSVKLVLNTACRKDSITKTSYITINNCNCSLLAQTNINTNVSCNNGNNGTATATISNGTGGPYTYSWSNGNSGTTSNTSIPITGLSAATYTVTITDGSCKSTTIVKITQPQPIDLGFYTQWSCPSNIPTAAITGFPDHGNPPYSYLWSNGQTTQTATGMPAGNYTLTVTDQNGCTVNNTINLAATPLIMTTSSQNNSCTTSGSASVTVSSGTALYTYSWSNGLITGPSSQTGTVTNSGLATGGYTVTVSDGIGCTTSQTFNIIGSSPASATFTNPPACINQQVCFTNTGSTGTYSWTIGAPVNVSGTTANFCATFLTAGTYSVKHIVTNAGCTNTVTQNITVTNCTGTGPTITATGSSICTGSCATVSSSGSGGTGPYTYSWSNGATTQNINPCPATTTTYTVKVTDSGGNTSTSTAVVTINPAVGVTTNTSNITCNGASTGSATVTGGGGTLQYIYVWSNGQTSQTATGLAAGNYTVTVTDSKGCSSTSTSTIISPPPLTGQFTKGTAACAACGCKQWILVNAAGGTSPYSYSWPDGYANRYKNQLCPGNYNVNIKDKNGCSVKMNLTAP